MPSGPTAIRNGCQWTVPGALVAGAVAMGTMVEITLHELGHFIMDRVLGADASISLHPFEPSGTSISGPVPAGHGWGVAAGPALPILFGSIVSILAWRHRRPGLLAVVLLGPIALLFEGANALVQLVERANGTDMTLLSALGLPVGAIGATAALALAAGLGSLSAAMSIAGLGPEVSVSTRWAAPLAGFSVYPVVGLIWVTVSTGAIARNLGLTVFGIITGLIVAAMNPGIVRRTGLESLHVRPATAWRVCVGAVVLVGMMLLVG